VANSAMLKLAGISRDTVAPDGGQILKDAIGEPTGMLIDNAMSLVTGKIAQPSVAQQKEAAKLATALYASRGWTGMHNVSVAAEDVTILREMAKAGTLPIRVDNFLDIEAADDVLSKGPSREGLLRVNGIKLYMDGALGSRARPCWRPIATHLGLAWRRHRRT